MSTHLQVSNDQTTKLKKKKQGIAHVHTPTSVQRLDHKILKKITKIKKQGIVHRDLKPENLLYTSNDETTREYQHIKVADFGLAR